MKINDIKTFGVISGIFIGIILIIFSFLFRINVIYFETLGKTPIYLGLIPVLLFLTFTLLNKRMTRSTLNRIYLVIAVFTFIYFNSMFQWSVECCPDEYESMFDWNASKGLSWIIHLPLVFIIILIQGLLFDILRELKMKE